LRKIRRVVQLLSAIGINSYYIGFFKGSIYLGNLKKICCPGLNCSSCPGALLSCPLALLQTSIAGIGTAHYSFFILGFLLLVGVTLGRFICGWFCPFGLIQELLFKIPLPKISWEERLKRLESLKYVVLVIFVLILPGFGTYGMSTAFCKYLCPVEVLEAHIPIMMVRPSLMSTVGPWFQWKLLLLIILLILALFMFKPFCRYLCPLGAIYSCFNSFSLYRLEVDADKCIDCKQCQAACKFKIPVYQIPNHRECMRCNDCLLCPSQALQVKTCRKRNISAEHGVNFKDSDS